MSDLSMDDRVVKIIELVRKKTYCSLDYLAATIGVSTRTIRNYIKQLNSDLDGIASLVNEKGKGYRFLIEDEHLFEDLIGKMNSESNLQDSPQRRIAFIIDRLLNNDESNTLDELAFDLNIGRTTLVNELKKASVAFETYNLFISGKQNRGMFLSGNELDIRFFILDNVYDHLYSGYPIDEDIKAEITKIAHKYDLESTTTIRLMHSIIVMLDRLLRNHPLEEMNGKYKKLLDTQEYAIALEIVATIESQLPVTIPEQEIIFITIPIAGRRTPTNDRTMADITITEEIKNLLEMIIVQVGFDKEIMLENETFVKDLQYHLSFMINRLMFNIRIKNPLLGDVKEKYPVAFKMAEIAGQVIEIEYAVKVPCVELGYLAFYFGVFISQNDARVRSLRNVAVICGTGRGTAKLIAIQLQRVLNHNTEIDLFSETEVSKEQLDQYDMVFSTVTLAIEFDSPLIMINEIFDENRVSQQIEKLTYLQRFKLKDSGNHNSIVKLLINEEKFFIFKSNKGYHGNVNAMIDDLAAKGYFDEGFKERLLQREEKGSMAFDQYIALPHTLNHASSKIELAVGIFPEMVQAGGKEIKLVFLLGIPKQTDYDASLLVKIYDEIIKIASNQPLVTLLNSSTSYEEFSKRLEHASWS